MNTKQIIESFNQPEPLKAWLVGQLVGRAWSLPDEPIYVALNRLNVMRRGGSRSSVAHDVIQDMSAVLAEKGLVVNGPGLMAVLNWLYLRK